MSRIIAIANQKGGVGKTTTVINLSASLAEAGKKVLTVDMDPQGNTSSGLGLDKDKLKNTIYQLLIGECKLEDCRQKSAMKGVSVLPSTVHLAGAEVELIGAPRAQFILKDELEKVKAQYDCILIDCPPSLSLLTINAMTAADSVLVPIQCEYYALEGLSQLLYTIDLVQKSLNPVLELEADALADLDIDSRIVIAGGAEYDGDYSVTPRLTEIVLPTHGYLMRDDLTVLEIPVSLVTNPQDGLTVIIG